MRKITAVLMALVASVAIAGPIAGPAEFKRDTIAVFEVSAKGDFDIDGDVPAGLSIEKSDKKWYIAGKPGQYKLSGTDFWVDFESKKSGRTRSSLTFVIVDTPQPMPPTPTPTPPAPTPPGPDARTNPFGDDLPRVLILWNPEGDSLTADQSAAMYGEASRKAIREFTPDNFRVLTIRAAPSDPILANAVKSGGKSYPWVKIGKGSRGSEGPLRSDKELMSMIDELKDAKADQPWTVGGTTFTPAPACRTVRQIVNGRVVEYTICP